MAGLAPPLPGMGWQPFLNLLPQTAHLPAPLCFQAELGDGEERKEKIKLSVGPAEFCLQSGWLPLVLLSIF